MSQTHEDYGSHVELTKYYHSLIICACNGAHSWSLVKEVKLTFVAQSDFSHYGKYWVQSKKAAQFPLNAFFNLSRVTTNVNGNMAITTTVKTAW